VRDNALAEDVVHDSWVAAIEGIDRFEGRARFRMWLCQIALNKARTRVERDRRSVPLSQIADSDGPVSAWQPP
jgi:RNA polymerase sigma-70 factor (ECF subfamily)